MRRGYAVRGATAVVVGVLSAVVVTVSLGTAPAQGVTSVKQVDYAARLLTTPEAQSVTGYIGTLVDGKDGSTATSWNRTFDDSVTAQARFAVSIYTYAKVNRQTVGQMRGTAATLLPVDVREVTCQVVERTYPKFTEVCWNEDALYGVAIRKFGLLGTSGLSIQKLGTIPDPNNPDETIELTATDSLKEKVASDAQWLRDAQKQKTLTGRA
jgi:hypothetical protein